MTCVLAQPLSTVTERVYWGIRSALLFPFYTPLDEDSNRSRWEKETANHFDTAYIRTHYTTQY